MSQTTATICYSQLCPGHMQWTLEKPLAFLFARTRLTAVLIWASNTVEEQQWSWNLSSQMAFEEPLGFSQSLSFDKTKASITPQCAYSSIKSFPEEPYWHKAGFPHPGGHNCSKRPNTKSVKSQQLLVIFVCQDIIECLPQDVPFKWNGNQILVSPMGSHARLISKHRLPDVYLPQI